MNTYLTELFLIRRSIQEYEQGRLSFLLKYIGYRGSGSIFNLGVRTVQSRSDIFIMFNVFEAHQKLGVRA